MRSSTKREVSKSSTSTTGVSTPAVSAKLAIVRCSRSTNASCGPSGTGVQSSGTRRASAPRRRRRADVGAAELRDRAAARRALDEAELEQVRLVDVLDRVRLLAERRRRASTARPGRRRTSRRSSRAARGRSARDRPRRPRAARAPRRATGVVIEPCVPHLGDVADAAQDPVRDPRRAARAAGDLLGRVVGDLDAEDPRRAADDRRELARLVVVEPEGHAEAVAQRRRQQPGARRRADERERRQVERQRARRRRPGRSMMSSRKSSSAG